MDQTLNPGTQKILKVLYISLIVQTVLALSFMGFSIYQKVSESYPKATLTLYDGPKTMHTSADTQVSVNGNNLFVYETNVNNSHKWVDDGSVTLSKTPVTYFDFDGKAVVEVNLPKMTDAITSCKVTPSSHGITPTISGKKIRFTIDKPGFYTVEINNSVERAIHIFANPLEKNVPNPNDPNVVYIGPGEWNVNTISLDNNQTLYISGGAVVHGMIRSNMAENITVRGRGIIDGSVNPSWVLEGQTAKVPVDLRSSKNITVEGIILLDSNAWVFNSFESEKANISNVKLISARPNGDGITLQSCRDFMVTNCFVRTWDDSLVVKNYGINSDNITFDNVQVWTDLAQSCEIGYETNKGNKQDSRITNISFKNITVLHNFHKPVIGIHNSDNALVRGIKYDNIIVEDAQMGSGDAGTNNQLIDISIAPSGWSTTPTRGSVKDVSINGLTVLNGQFPPSRILGYDEEHAVENVSIKNLTILGKKITNKTEGSFKLNPFTKDIKFE